MKKIFIFSLFFVGFLSAQVVDKVVMSVNGEPITTYDIQITMKQANLSQTDAVEYLISNALINAEIKRRNISVDEYEVDSRLELIAKQNNISLYKLKEYLISKGNFTSFTENIKTDIKKQKLFDSLAYSKLSVDENDAKYYYEEHISDFTQFKNAEVIKYSSLLAADLENIIKNPLANTSTLKTEHLSLESNQMPFTFMKLIDDTKEGSYTKILRDTTGYVMFFVNKKNGAYVTPFENVKNTIMNIIASTQRDRIIKSYFQKEKSKAIIKTFE
jgi:parvulin-like peptidyl-prolyl isomerase